MFIDIQTNEQTVRLSDPSAPKYAFVLRCFEWAKYHNRPISAPTRGEVDGGLTPKTDRDPHGLPDLCKAVYADWVTFFTDWQWYLWDIWIRELNKANVTISTTVLMDMFARCFKGDVAWTNKHSWNDAGLALHPSDINTDQAPVQLETCVPAGSVIKLTGPATTKGGQLCYPYEAFDLSLMAPNPESVNRDTHPWLFGPAMNSVRAGYNPNRPGDKYEKWTYERIQQHFHMLNGLMVPILIQAKGGGNFIPADRVRILGPGEAWPDPLFDER